MRFFLPLLLLSVAAPALADPGDQDAGERRAERIQERQQQREERAERPTPPRFERPAPQPAVRIEQPQAPVPQIERAERPSSPQVRFDRPERRFDGGQTRSADGGARWRDRQPEQPQTPPPVVGAGAAGRPSGDSVSDWRWRDRRGGERPAITPPRPAVQIDGATYTDRRPRDGDRWRDRDGRRDGDQWTGRNGTDRRYDRDDWRNRRSDTGAWRPDWRRDPRYDWQRYRDRHRSIFRIGVYIDPFGWGYRPISTGWQIYPDYYSQRYWIGDPSYYSLPMVSWPYRWVRYYDDALLVDVRDGRVVDVINAFFW